MPICGFRSQDLVAVLEPADDGALASFHDGEDVRAVDRLRELASWSASSSDRSE
jgi:hypothetical protein